MSTASGTEVAMTLIAKSMDFPAGIMTMESTKLVSTIMADGAAIGSIMTRTGQSALKGTTN